jgi:hypothetical protein
MPDYQFIEMGAKRRRPLPGKLPVAAKLDDWETRWLLAYSNSPPKTLVREGVLLVAPEEIRPITVYPRWCTPLWRFVSQRQT